MAKPAELGIAVEYRGQSPAEMLKNTVQLLTA